jgi:hypothetical protein
MPFGVTLTKEKCNQNSRHARALPLFARKCWNCTDSIQTPQVVETCETPRGITLCPLLDFGGPRHIPMELWYRDHRILGVWDRKVRYLSLNLGPPEQTCMVLRPTKFCPFQSMSDPNSPKVGGLTYPLGKFYTNF